MTEPSPRKWIRWLWIPSAFVLLAAALPGAMMLLVAETFAGRCAGLLTILLGCLPAAALLSRENFRRRYWPLGFVGMLTLIAALVLLIGAPTGDTGQQTGIRQVFLSNAAFPRFSPMNVVPEIDQFKFGFLFGAKLGVLQDAAEARRASAVFLPLYREMETRPDYRALGSVERYTLAELWGGTFDVGHVYQYVPPALPASAQGRKPVLIVLHGFGGNNKAYLYAWEQFGVRNDCIVLCPSFGFGLYRGGETDAIERVRAYAIDTLHADPERIFLAGYSNGGLGVSRTIAEFPEHYAGAILLSPVIDSGALANTEFARSWGTRPILCITGNADRRIAERAVAARIGQLKALGVNFTYTVIEKGDHFLMFESREKCFQEIEAAMRGLSAPH